MSDYQIMPPLSDDEYQALKADIQARGVMVEVEYDEDGDILDGYHRVQIADELGISYPSIVRAGLSETEKLEHALALNLARRHLTREQRRELVAKLRREGWSYPRIAERLKVDPKTAWSDVQSTLENSKVGQPVRITGKDGRSRPATKPPRSPSLEMATVVVAGDDDEEEEDCGDGCWNCKHALDVSRGPGDYFCRAYGMVVHSDHRSWCGHWENETEKHHTMDVMGSSKSPEWYTPPHIIELTLKLFGGTIDTDPCSNSKENPNVPATFLYTKEDDGLAQTWHGAVYMNPPYGTEIPQWVEALVSKYENGEIREAIALLPGRIDTQWFQPLYDYLICHIRGRLNYPQSKSATPFPSVIVYLGDNRTGFIEAFRELGPIMRRVG